MNCPEARPLLSAWVDGEFDSDDLRAHVASCPSCSAVVAKYRQADGLLRQAAQRMVPERSEAQAAKIVAAVRGGFRRRQRIVRLSLSAAAALVLVVAAGALYVNLRSAPPMEVVLYARPDAVAGSPARLMFLVRNHQTGAAVSGAHVAARAGGRTVEAESDASGLASLSLPVPDGAASFEVSAEVTSPVGRETLAHSFAVRRPIKLLVSTDKPLYQPTQTVHLRALGMNTLAGGPVAGDAISLVIQDPNGNRVFRKEAKTSDFGTAAFDFTLADEVTFGTYRITASIAGATSERAFEVKRYVLPKFKTELALDRTYYSPAQLLSGRVKARYFFGAPVANGRVRVVGETWQVDRFETAFTVEGRTDAGGAFAFSEKVPAKLFGTELEGGDASLRVTAEVIDGAEHKESAAVAAAVSQDDLKVWVLPEGGSIVPGVENRLFVVTAYPDGALAKTTLSVGDRVIPSDGIAEIAAAAGMEVVARDEKGAIGRAVPATGAPRSFLVRPDSYRPRAGKTLGLTALASFPEGRLYVDVVREGVTLVTKTMEVRGGRGELAIDVPAEVAGTMQISAYRVLPDATIERDTRTVLVEAARGLTVDVKTDRESVRPGEEIGIDFDVRDAQGRPAVAELALAIVDEAVFALHESRPGLEKVYFWIQENLLTPKYQLKDCPPLAAPPASVLRDDSIARLRCATVISAAEAPVVLQGFKGRQAQIDDYARHFNGSLRSVGIVVALIALVVWIVAYVSRHLGRGAAVAAAVGILLFGLCTLGIVIPGMLAAQRAGIAGRRMAPDAPVPTPEEASIRVRRDFPETLYWNPSIITDDAGHARLTVRAADSITTWRLTASAVSQTGALGATDRGIKVFQELFIDLDLPVSLTQGDTVSVPVAVHNYLKEAQDVTVRLTTDEGFALYDQAEKTVRLGPDEVRAVHFRFRAAAFGMHAITASARSARAGDAVERKVEILPDGKEMNFAASDSIAGHGTLRLRLPEESIDGAGRMWVRIFPSRLSEIVTGLERLVQMPYG